MEPRVRVGDTLIGIGNIRGVPGEMRGEGRGGRVPGVDGLGQARDEAPIEGTDLSIFQITQTRIKVAAGSSSHVLGADQRLVVSLEALHGSLEVVDVAIVVEADDV
jgi:hypothetical protein